MGTMLHHVYGRKWMKQGWSGVETCPNVLRSMPECFQGINKVIRNDSKEEKPRNATFGYG